MTTRPEAGSRWRLLVHDQDPEEPTEWDRHQFTEMEARAANSEYNQHLRGRRGPLTPRESAARRQYKRSNYRPARLKTAERDTLG